MIVGRSGWKTEDLQTTLRTHPANGNHLLWFDDASDKELSLLYNECRDVIVASCGEGFGLPLLEALGYRKPVLAGSIPVFRLQKKMGVSYFSADIETAALADAIHTYLGKGVSSPRQSPCVTSWADTTKAMLDALTQGAK